MRDKGIRMVKMIAKLWHWGVKTFIPYTIPGFIILALAKAGALLQNNSFIFVMIVGICVIIGLVAFNKLKEPYYPHLIGAIGLALLLQSTLMGPGLVGSDIHKEYYFYYSALNGWDTSLANPFNTTIGTTVIAPFLTNVFRIPGYWVYKVIFPFLFAFVPLLLYFIFRKEFGSKTAYFASLFFIIVPTWSMEMIGLPRQMLGELMLALCLYLILVSKWRLKIRVPLLIVLGTLGSMFHYVMGPTILLYLGLGCLFLVFFKRRVFPVKWLSLVVVLLLILSGTYYSLVGQGVAIEAITGVTFDYVGQALDLLPKQAEPPTIEPTIEPTAEPTTEPFWDPHWDEPILESQTGTMGGLFAKLSPLIRTAWGFDFMDVNISGKIFRIFQYLTQIAIVVGVVYLVKERKRYSAEYLSLCVASVVILGACMFVPRFANLIGATRFYHIALFLLAPAFILGGKAIFRNFKLLTVCLVIPYFLFTSGFIFEVTQQTDISQVNMPYSISLSNQRVDMIGVFTSNDIAVRDWAVDNLPGWIYADTHSILLITEKATMYDFLRLSKALRTGEFKRGGYIFLSERNNRTRTLTFRPSEKVVTSGRRATYSYEEVGMDKLISEGRIIHKQGDACILEVGEWHP